MLSFIGGSYELRRKKADSQRTINMFPADVESGSGKSPRYLKSIPGLSVFSPDSGGGGGGGGGGTGLFVAVSRFVGIGTFTDGTPVMTSPDGVNWTLRTAYSFIDSGDYYTNNWYSIARGAGVFVAVAQGNTTVSGGPGGTIPHVMTSPDGVTWTNRVSPSPGTQWRAVAWNGSVFAALGRGDNVGGTRPDYVCNAMTSTNGITWAATSYTDQNAWQAMCWAQELGLFVAVGQSGTGNRVLTSPNGSTWTYRSSAADQVWIGIAWSGTILVAVSTNGGVMTSPNGINWTLRTAASADTWFDVAYGNGLFVAVATAGSGSRIMTSPDGITWTSRTAPAVRGWSGVVYGGGKWVAVAQLTPATSAAMTSPDGITWTLQTTPPNRAVPTDAGWKDITWALV